MTRRSSMKLSRSSHASSSSVAWGTRTGERLLIRRPARADSSVLGAAELTHFSISRTIRGGTGLCPLPYRVYRDATMPSSPSRPGSERALVSENRRFYDGLWSAARLVEPQRFNTWPLVQSLLPGAARRLEIAPGLRPRLPIEGTQFVDISVQALGKLSARGAQVTLGEVTSLP